MSARSLSIVLSALALAACDSDQTSMKRSIEGAEQSDAASDQSVTGPERRILAFGDSLFAGYGVGLEHSYPAKLEAAMRAQGINVRVTNAAVSGETSAAGAQRLPFALDGQKVKPDLVLLELGGNDMLRRLSPEQTRASFVEMLG